VLLFIEVPHALPNREEGEPDRVELETAAFKKLGEGSPLAQEATATARTANSNVAGLARFFPEATPLRIPVQFVRTGVESSSSPSSFGENTVIEFGTSREVLFACSIPLEFADIVRLRNSDGSLDAEASVVAVQYLPGKTIVAARFLREVPNWIVKP
jgi:hypothetical protein